MATTLHVRNDILSAVLELAVQALPEECCGILLGRRDGADTRVNGFRASPNVSGEDRTRRYEIDPDLLVSVLLDHRQSPQRVVGFYHSHPDGTALPSSRDLESAWPGKALLIVGVGPGRKTTARGWALHAEGDRWVEQDLRIDDD